MKHAKMRSELRHCLDAEWAPFSFVYFVDSVDFAET